MNAKLLFIHAISPLHAGIGQGAGVIDLPIAREKATQIPFLPGSTLKGVFRNACGDDKKRESIFGPKTDNAELHAGSVTFTDARLLLFPVRSLRGVFAWVTSPLLLRRLVRDAESISGLPAFPQIVPAVDKDNACLLASDSCVLKIQPEDAETEKVILEDLLLSIEKDTEKSAVVAAWAKWLGEVLFPDEKNERNKEWREELKSRLCVVSDEMLSFLLETATEISARICLEDDKKTVKDGQLWYEEALPTETVLVSLVVAASVKSNPQEVFETVKSIASNALQFGGKATVGRGLCRAQLF